MRTPPNERLTSDIAERTVPGKPDEASRSERRCVLSGDSSARHELIRLAISPDGEVLPDPAAKAPGRGAWIAPDRDALEAAMADGHLKRALMRAFKGGPADARLSWPDDLPQRIENALARNLLDRLGLELRGGNVVLGSARIEEQARTGRIALLLHANDSSEDGRKRLDQAWRVGMDAQGSGRRGTVLPLDRAALSMALGRENVVHLGIGGSSGGPSGGTSAGTGGRRANTLPASERIGIATARLLRFSGTDPGTENGSGLGD